MKRVRMMVTLLAVAALVAGACTSGTGGATGKTTLNFWRFTEAGEGSFPVDLEKGFESKYPNVDLNITTYPEANYGVKVQTAIAAGKAPDLVLVYGPEQMAQGLLLPLDDMVKQKGIDLSKYVQSVVQPGDQLSCNWQGHLYCLGSYAGSVQLVYNKDMFDAAGIPYPKPWPPMTPEQFVADACKLTDKANGIWGGAAADPTAYDPYEVFFSADGRTAEFNSPEAVHQVEVLASGYQQGCLSSSNAFSAWDQGMDYFAKGQLAMVITGLQGMDKVEKAGINYGASGSPTPTGYVPYFYVWTDSVGVMASTKHPTEAMDFVDYLTTDGEKIRFQDTGDIPLNLDTARSVNWAHGVPGREEGLEVLSHARTSIFIPPGDVTAPFYDAWGYVLGGEKTAQQALDDADPAIQENLDKAWKSWEAQG